MCRKKNQYREQTENTTTIKTREKTSVKMRVSCKRCMNNMCGIDMFKNTDTFSQSILTRAYKRSGGQQTILVYPSGQKKLSRLTTSVGHKGVYSSLLPCESQQ